MVDHVHITEGNPKLGKTANISTLPGFTCPADAPCHDSCYARKFLFRPSVLAAWSANTRMVAHDRPRYFREIDAYLTKRNPERFRFHVAGDIPDKAYFQSMVRLARAHPKTAFLAFTKAWKYCTGVLPSNLSIVASAWPKRPLPPIKRFPIAYMQDGSEKRVPTGAFQCKGGCDTCMRCFRLTVGQSVVFHKH